MASLWDALRGVDQALFHWINHDWTHPWLDAFLPWLTDLNRSRIAVFGALPVALAWWVYARRGAAVKTILAMVVAVGLCDAVSHRFVKPLVHRSRPGGLTGFSVVLRTRAHSGYSFPSNHAANTFAGAAVLGTAFPALRWPALAAAFLVAYSRVYVGVHYPFDVAAGAALGLLVGLMVGAALQRFGAGGLAPRTKAKKKG